MPELVNPVPEGYKGINPYITVKNCAEAIDFYKRAFGAEEIFRIAGDDGKIGHAEIRIGGGILMLSDEFPDFDALSPETIGGTPFKMMVYVDDVDRFAENAVKEGLRIVRPIEDQFHGDRSGHFIDPFGRRWCFATHLEDVPAEVLNSRVAGNTAG